MRDKRKMISGSILKRAVISAAAMLFMTTLVACSAGNETADASEPKGTVASDEAYTDDSSSDKDTDDSAAGPDVSDEGSDRGSISATPEDILEYAFSSFNVKDLEGNEVTQDIFSDAKLTMINFWGTFCGPCINEMPDLGELSAELSEDGKVKIVGIPLDVVTLSSDNEIVADDEMVAKAVEIVDQTGAAYTHLIPEGEFGIYILGSGATQYVPSTYFVDSEGKIVGDPVVGAMDKEKWQEEIENRLVEVGE